MTARYIVCPTCGGHGRVPCPFWRPAREALYRDAGGKCASPCIACGDRGDVPCPDCGEGECAPGVRQERIAEARDG